MPLLVTPHFVCHRQYLFRTDLPGMERFWTVLPNPATLLLQISTKPEVPGDCCHRFSLTHKDPLWPDKFCVHQN